MRKIDPFVPLLVLMIILAWLWPGLGVPNAYINPSEVTQWGVCAVFFFYGLKLNLAKLRDGLSNMRLHIVVQLTTFVLFPLLVWIVMPSDPDTLWLGVFFVAALPSTVSSSVVMVSIAKGNVTAAIFNASISSLIGVALTPLIMSLYLNAEMGASGLGDVVFKLLLQVVLPVGLGMVLNRWWGEWATKKKVMLRWFDQIVILGIVWTAFCEGFSGGMFESVSLGTLALLTLGMVGLFFLVYGITSWVCGLLKFNREDRIAVVFCGSKKSLVHGTVMSRVLVSDAASVGLLLLPIMIYHAAQLLIVSYIAQRMGDEVDHKGVGHEIENKK